MLKARVMSAKVMDYEGIKTLLQHAGEAFARLKHLWLDAGYRGEGKGKDWVEKTLGWSVDLVERPRKIAPEAILRVWAEQWRKEGLTVDWQKLLAPRGFVVLPRRWVVEWTFSWLAQNRRMSKDYERLAESGEAFIYGAMSRLMVKSTWLAREAFRTVSPGTWVNKPSADAPGCAGCHPASEIRVSPPEGGGSGRRSHR